MFKNRTAQLVLQSSYMSLGIVAIVSFFGLFEMTWRIDAWILFTNQCNFLCIGIMIAELVQTIKKKEDSYVTLNPILKFVGLLGIMLTGIIYYAFISQFKNPINNFRVGTILMHVVLPILYIADWILFYEKNKVKLTYPLFALLLPIAYVIFIYIHAAFYKFDTSILNYNQDGPYIYPYFFLNVEKLGIGTVLLWCFLIVVGFLAAGFLMYGLDKLINYLMNKKKNKDIDNEKTVS